MEIKKKNIFFVFLIFAFLLFCILKIIFPSGSMDSGGELKEDVLRIGGVFSKEDGLNPFFNRNSDNVFAKCFIFSSLVDFNEKGEVIPQIAKEWSISPDFRSITFKLKKGISFHNGRPLTAHDVRWTFKKLINSNEETFYSFNSFISSIETPDRETVIFRFNRVFPVPEYYFCIEILSSSLNADKRDSSFDKHPVGSGPYIFSWMDGKGNILLKRNETYFEEKGKPKFIYFKSYPNKAALWAGFMREEVDIFNDLSYAQYKIIENSEWCNLLFLSAFRYFAVILSNRHPFLKDRNIRYAIDLAIDRKEIIESIFQGKAQEIFGPLLVNSPYFCNILRERKYDPEKAKKILKTCGFSDINNDGILEKEEQPFIIELSIHNNPKIIKIAKLLKLQLKELGIIVKIKILDTEESSKLSYDDTLFDVTIDERPSFISELSFTYWLDSMGYNAYFTDETKRFTELYWNALKVKKFSERKKVFEEMQKIIDEEKKCLFLIQPQEIYAINKRLDISGISFAPYFRLNKLRNATITKGGRDEIQDYQKGR